jgi:L-lactate dehydrogenase
VATNNLFAVLLNPELDLGINWERDEVEAFVRYLHDTPPAPGFDQVQYPGEYEAMHRAAAATHLEINPKIWSHLAALAGDLGVDMPAA